MLLVDHPAMGFLKLENPTYVLIGHPDNPWFVYTRTKGVNPVLLVIIQAMGGIEIRAVSSSPEPWKYFFRPNKITLPVTIDYQAVDLKPNPNSAFSPKKFRKILESVQQIDFFSCLLYRAPAERTIATIKRIDF
ncbi:hypothetical protein [Terrimonas ferruginea]|uniref:hypothetical protein n=1 Tax=Terrimonas ferruginea TaxID=249 RepID=UPI00048D4623|nr:hypothetical protein [Terrimonas ferruginea]